MVVGGGPVGVTLAMMCARRGLRSVVLERSLDVYALPRAIVMDDEVQRALWLNGAAEGLTAVVSPLAGAEFVDAAGERIIGIEVPEGIEFPLSFPPVVRYYQPELESFLRERAVAAGVEIRLGVEVVSVAQDEGGAWAVLADGTEIRGRWLVAADGASSPVRRSLGIAFESQGFDQEWLVVDVRLHEGAEPELPRLVQQICDPQRPTTFVPGHGRYRRWEFQLQPGETAETMTGPDAVWALLEPWITGADAELVRAVVYRFHATVAERFRSGRILLAGDAAHQMPPFLGQGLCTGVRDAANLAWKLEFEVAGLAGDALVETYDTERRPHAAGVVAHAVDMGRLLDQLAGRGGDQEGLTSAYGGQRPFPRLEAGLIVGDHPLCGRQIPNLMLADGSRLDDGDHDGFVILLPTTDAVDRSAFEPWSALGADVLVAPALADLGITGAVLVRPDRMVAAVSADTAPFDRITASLASVLTPQV